MAQDDGQTDTTDLINDNLKRIFQQEVDRDLPERFTELIEKLRTREATAKHKNAER